MPQKSKFVLVTTTVDSRIRAERLARAIVDCQLAACVQFFPVTSVYRWKGKRERAAEYLLLAKTGAALSSRLTGFIRKNHSYELPEITVVKLDGGLPEYLRWITDETIGAAGRKG